MVADFLNIFSACGRCFGRTGGVLLRAVLDVGGVTGAEGSLLPPEEASPLEGWLGFGFGEGAGGGSGVGSGFGNGYGAGTGGISAFPPPSPAEGSVTAPAVPGLITISAFDGSDTMSMTVPGGVLAAPSLTVVPAMAAAVPFPSRRVLFVLVSGCFSLSNR